jgi:hypothetical protein
VQKNPEERERETENREREKRERERESENPFSPVLADSSWLWPSSLRVQQEDKF